MRKLVEWIIIAVFDCLPKRLKVRSFFMYWLFLPFIILKFTRRAVLGRRTATRATVVSPISPVEMARESSRIPEDSPRQEICVRFSGGTDSTYVAAYMAKRFRKVHLLTFDSSYQSFTLNIIRSDPRNTECNAGYLRRRFGDERFTHTIVPLDAMRDKIYFDIYRNHFRRKDFLSVSLCPSCTVAMHRLTIEFCKERGIENVTDGSSMESGAHRFQMQHIDNLLSVSRAYRVHGLRYILNPCYEIQDSALALFSEGIFPELVDKTSFKYRRQTQQFCIPIQLQSICKRIHGSDTPPEASRMPLFIEDALVRLNR